MISDKEMRKRIADMSPQELLKASETFEALFDLVHQHDDNSIANTNPDYYKQEIDRLTAENERLSQLLHDEMSQLQIATDLGNKRWLALNDIYENGEKHNSNWCKRKAQEGLSSK